MLSTVHESIASTVNNETTSQSAYFRHHLGYDIILYGSITVAFLVVWKLFKAYRNKLVIPIYDSSQGHHWVSFQFPPVILSNVVFCNVCKGIIVDGMYCDLCGICADSSSCHREADTKIPCKSSSIEVKGEYEGIHRHHWIQGNLPAHSSCCHCLEDIAEEDALKDYRCCWCQRTVHEDNCYPKIGKEPCDLGKYQRYIIPPESIKYQLQWLKGKQSRVVRSINLTKPVADWRPLIIIGNRKSGNNDGYILLKAFRYVLNASQVIDLCDLPPEHGLYWCKLLSKTHPDIIPWILVAGGDGTVAWVLQTIDKLKLNPEPYVGIIPLGTGNDLARVFGWGTSFSAESPVREVMDCLEKCKMVALDRWHVKLSPPMFGLSFAFKSLVMNNYLSIGVDALVAFNFHQTRESKLYNWFGSRLLNKFLYFSYGTKDVLERKCSQLNEKIILEMDGIRQELPQLESIVLLNIPSWGGGADIWSNTSKSEEIPEQRIDDRMIEVVGIYSSLHIGQIMIGLSEPYRFGQAKSVTIKLFDQLPMQIDGEPWLQHPCTVKVDWYKQAKMLKVVNP